MPDKDKIAFLPETGGYSQPAREGFAPVFSRSVHVNVILGRLERARVHRALPTALAVSHSREQGISRPQLRDVRLGKRPIRLLDDKSCLG